MYILKHPAVIIFGAFVGVAVGFIFLFFLVVAFLNRDPVPEDCEYERVHNQYCVREGEL